MFRAPRNCSGALPDKTQRCLSRSWLVISKTQNKTEACNFVITFEESRWVYPHEPAMDLPDKLPCYLQERRGTCCEKRNKVNVQSIEALVVMILIKTAIRVYNMFLFLELKKPLHQPLRRSLPRIQGSLKRKFINLHNNSIRARLISSH